MKYEDYKELGSEAAVKVLVHVCALSHIHEVSVVSIGNIVVVAHLLQGVVILIIIQMQLIKPRKSHGFLYLIHVWLVCM